MPTVGTQRSLHIRTQVLFRSGLRCRLLKQENKVMRFTIKSPEIHLARSYVARMPSYVARMPSYVARMLSFVAQVQSYLDRNCILFFNILTFYYTFILLVSYHHGLKDVNEPRHKYNRISNQISLLVTLCGADLIFRCFPFLFISRHTLFTCS